jgi:hypothetical protein
MVLDCASRTFTGSSALKCGEGCVYNPENEVCMGNFLVYMYHTFILKICEESCPTFLSASLLTGVCVPDQCALRTFSSDLQKCGPFPCFLESYQCSVNCNAVCN